MDSLRSLGRSVYEAYPQDAERIAQALNQTAASKFNIKTVQAGEDVDRLFMDPAPGTGRCVKAVLGWAIRDASNNWQYKAEVN
jgi:hypothetical protein